MDVDIPIFGAIFTIAMIIVGQFFLMNLILAVIIFSFIKAQKIDLEQEIKQLDDKDVKLEGQSGSQSGQALNSLDDIQEDLENASFHSEEKKFDKKQTAEFGDDDDREGFSSRIHLVHKHPRDNR